MAISPQAARFRLPMAEELLTFKCEFVVVNSPCEALDQANIVTESLFLKASG